MIQVDFYVICAYCLRWSRSNRSYPVKYDRLFKTGARWLL